MIKTWPFFFLLNWLVWHGDSRRRKPVKTKTHIVTTATTKYSEKSNSTLMNIILGSGLGQNGSGSRVLVVHTRMSAPEDHNTITANVRLQKRFSTSVTEVDVRPSQRQSICTRFYWLWRITDEDHKCWLAEEPRVPSADWLRAWQPHGFTKWRWILTTHREPVIRITRHNSSLMTATASMTIGEKVKVSIRLMTCW